MKTLRQMERDAIRSVMIRTSGNTTEAALLLGIGRTTLYRRLRTIAALPDHDPQPRQEEPEQPRPAYGQGIQRWRDAMQALKEDSGDEAAEEIAAILGTSSNMVIMLRARLAQRLQEA